MCLIQRLQAAVPINYHVIIRIVEGRGVIVICSNLGVYACRPCRLCSAVRNIDLYVINMHYMKNKKWNFIIIWLGVFLN